MSAKDRWRGLTHFVPSANLTCTLVVGLLVSTSSPTFPIGPTAVGGAAALDPANPPGIAALAPADCETRSGAGDPRRLPDPENGFAGFLGGGVYASV
jgi:hypothetical protein